MKFNPPDASISLNYVTLLNQLFENFRTIKSFDQLELLIGRDKLVDVSDYMEYQSASRLANVPEKYPGRTYLFKNELGFRGRLDINFRDNSLDDANTTVYFKGFMAKRKVKKYYRDLVLPAFKQLFNKPDDVIETDLVYDVLIGDFIGDSACSPIILSVTVGFRLDKPKLKTQDAKA